MTDNNERIDDGHEVVTNPADLGLEMEIVGDGPSGMRLLLIPFGFLLGVLVLVVVGAALGWFDQSPYEAYGIPDPPPPCERGEAPQRLYLNDGSYAMTCRVAR